MYASSPMGAQSSTLPYLLDQSWGRGPLYAGFGAFMFLLYLAWGGGVAGDMLQCTTG